MSDPSPAGLEQADKLLKDPDMRELVAEIFDAVAADIFEGTYIALKAQMDKQKDALEKIAKGQMDQNTLECAWCTYTQGRHGFSCPASIAQRALK